jgi:uncharacterized coiled-coil DUF342 family protein
MRIVGLISAASVVLTLAANARAQDLAAEAKQLLAAMKSEQAKAPALKQDADRLAAANEQLLKEGKLYQEQIKVRLGPIADAIKADAVRLKADTDRHNAGIQQHNAGCQGELPRPQYDRCMGQKPYWDRSKANLDARKAQMQRRVDDYDRQYKQYAVRRDQINAQMKQNFAAWQQRKQAYEQIQARLKQYAARFQNMCSTAVQRKNRGGKDYSSNVEEALSYCGSVNWDGTASGRPPLVEVLPPFSSN